MKITKLRNTTVGLAVFALIAAPTIVNPLSVFAADGGAYNTEGSVGFLPNTDTINPVDPTNPGKDVTPLDPDGNPGKPGTPGPLSIDFVSTLNFGSNKISSSDEVYYAEPQVIWNDTDEDSVVENGETSTRPAYVQVSDNRGTNSGWTLTVRQETQLNNRSAQNSVLTGAEIKLKNGTASSHMSNTTAPIVNTSIILVPGATSTVMTAAAGGGAGTWVDYFGTLENINVEGTAVEKNTAVTLSVPGSTPKDAVLYSATLIWTLSEIPEN